MGWLDLKKINKDLELRNDAQRNELDDCWEHINNLQNSNSSKVREIETLKSIIVNTEGQQYYDLLKEIHNYGRDHYILFQGFLALTGLKEKIRKLIEINGRIGGD